MWEFIAGSLTGGVVVWAWKLACAYQDAMNSSGPTCPECGKDRPVQVVARELWVVPGSAPPHPDQN